jgi:hypothetical protein
MTQYNLVSLHYLTSWHQIKCLAGYAEDWNLNECVSDALIDSQQWATFAF